MAANAEQNEPIGSVIETVQLLDTNEVRSPLLSVSPAQVSMKKLFSLGPTALSVTCSLRTTNQKEKRCAAMASDVFRTQASLSLLEAFLIPCLYGPY